MARGRSSLLFICLFIDPYVVFTDTMILPLADYAERTFDPCSLLALVASHRSERFAFVKSSCRLIIVFFNFLLFINSFCWCKNCIYSDWGLMVHSWIWFFFLYGSCSDIMMTHDLTGCIEMIWGRINKMITWLNWTCCWSFFFSVQSFHLDSTR